MDDLINEPQLPRLQTAIYHMGLDVKNESPPVHVLCVHIDIYIYVHVADIVAKSLKAKESLQPQDVFHH